VEVESGLLDSGLKVQPRGPFCQRNANPTNRGKTLTPTAARKAGNADIHRRSIQ
jgi:hypothetical protein